MTLGNTERHIGQTKLRLTPRGKTVVTLLVAAVVITLVTYLNNEITPDECKVPFEELSSFCKRYLYP